MTSTARRAKFKTFWNYRSLDYTHGPNVDVIGDAHMLSRFLPSRSFDVIYSAMVIEHLYCPWLYVLEANKLLKENGIIITHAPWACPLHAEPWDFFRPSIHSWQSLFNELTGYEIIDAFEAENAALVRALSVFPGETRSQYDPTPVYTSVIARKVSEPRVDWPGYKTELSRGSYNHD